MGARAQPAGWGKKIIQEGTEVPRTVIKLELPSHILKISGLLDVRANECVEKLYKKLNRSLPVKLTMVELVHAQAAAHKIEHEECLRIKANSRTDLDLIVGGLYAKSIFLDWRNKNELALFLDKKHESLNLNVDGRHYLVKKIFGEYNEYIIERNNKNAFNDVLLHAIDLIRLRDIIETGCLDAAQRYTRKSSTLASKEMQDLLADIFIYIKKYGDNPKIEEIARLLEERKGKKCAILCEGSSLVGAFSEKFPSAFVTNHPTKTDLMHFDTIIIATPGKHEVGAVWAVPGHEIIILSVKGTVDDSRYWQNAKSNDNKQEFIHLPKNNIGGSELTLF